MSDEADIMIEVKVETSPGDYKKRKIGPYSEDDLDQHGYPPKGDVNDVLWMMFGDLISVQQVEE